MKPGTTLHRAFHRLWTRAVDKTDYVKDDWKNLENLIDAEISGKNPIPHSLTCRCTDCATARADHDAGGDK